MNSIRSIEKALRLAQAVTASSELPVLLLAHDPKPSLRSATMSVSSHPETLRRKLMKLVKREREIQAQLIACFSGEDTPCLMDPTYLRETEERLLVFAIHS